MENSKCRKHSKAYKVIKELIKVKDGTQAVLFTVLGGWIVTALLFVAHILYIR